MRLLIVDDNTELAEITEELLLVEDRFAQRIESISLAEDLATAVCLLPGHDAVLCDGRFPAAQGAPVDEEWEVVHEEAVRKGIHFVLYSGCAEAIEGAHQLNVRAVPKPSAPEDIYAALIAPDSEARSVADAGEPDVVAFHMGGKG